MYQTNIGTVSKATLGKLLRLRDRVERVVAYNITFSIDTILNQTEPKWTVNVSNYFSGGAGTHHKRGCTPLPPWLLLWWPEFDAPTERWHHTYLAAGGRGSGAACCLGEYSLIIIMIIIIMKNFNTIGIVPMVTMAQTQSTANCRNTHTHTWIARIHSHTYTNTVTTVLCVAPAQLLHNF